MPVHEIIAGLVARFLAEDRAKDAYEINCGSCQDFAEELVRELDRQGLGSDACEIWVDDLLLGEAMDDDRGQFDRVRIERDHPSLVPPEGLSWDDMDRLAEEYGFAGGTHVWVVIEGRHYDAEAPAGVDNAFDLPFFRRSIEDFLAARAAVP